MKTEALNLSRIRRELDYLTKRHIDTMVQPLPQVMDLGEVKELWESGKGCVVHPIRSTPPGKQHRRGAQFLVLDMPDTDHPDRERMRTLTDQRLPWNLCH